MQSHQQHEGNADPQDLSDEIEILPELSKEEEEAILLQEKARLIKFYHSSQNYQISNWYSQLEQFTYASEYFILTVHEAYILNAIYYDHPLTEEDLAVKAKLVEKVRGAIDRMNNQNPKVPVFMKCATRSPKDGCWDYRNEEEAQQAINSLIHHLKSKGNLEEMKKDELSYLLYDFFLEVSKEKLKIFEPQRFLDLFGKSDRVVIDLNDMSFLRGGVFEKIKKGDLTNDQRNEQMIKIWVREWQDCKWSQQFRVFYHNYQVTAISQYDQMCYFPEIKNQQQAIIYKVQQFFQQIQGKLRKIQLSSGVMDLIVRKNYVKLIEINIFDPNTRASLFNWEKDSQLLRNGPCEFRYLPQIKYIAKSHLGSIMGMIDKNSAFVIESALSELKLSSLWQQMI